MKWLLGGPLHIEGSPTNRLENIRPNPFSFCRLRKKIPQKILSLGSFDALPLKKVFANYPKIFARPKKVFRKDQKNSARSKKVYSESKKVFANSAFLKICAEIYLRICRSQNKIASKVFAKFRPAPKSFQKTFQAKSKKTPKKAKKP
jgi:hypothetical protein